MLFDSPKNPMGYLIQLRIINDKDLIVNDFMIKAIKIMALLE
jgi:hypothetical protein